MTTTGSGLRFFARNSIWYAVGNIFLRVANLILIPIYTRHLSLVDYGILETALVSIQACVIVFDLGFYSSLIRYYPIYREQGDEEALLKTVYSVVLFAGIMFLGFAAFFCGGIAQLVFGATTYNLIVLIVFGSAYLQTGANLFFGYVRAKNDAKTFSVLSAIIFALQILFTYILVVHFHLSVLGALSASVVTYSIFQIYNLSQINILRRFRFSFETIKKCWQFGWPIMVSSLALFITQSSNRYFLASLSGFDQVAIYGLGYRITSVLLVLVVTPFQLSLGPYVYNVSLEEARSVLPRLLSYLLLILVVSSMLLVSVLEIIFPLIAPSQYSDASLVVLYVLPVIILTGTFYWANSLLNIIMKNFIIGISLVISAVVNLILNYLLIPRYGWVGAAIATIISYVVANIIIIRNGLKYFPVNIEWQRILKISLTAGLFLLFYFSTRFMMIGPLLHVAMNLFVVLLLILVMYRFGVVTVQEKLTLQRFIKKQMGKILSPSAG